MKTRILITGGRDFTDVDFIDSTLDKIREDYLDNIFLILGGASGVDTLAECWATYHKISHIVLYAEWKKHGRKRAGYIRNMEMANENPDVAIVFPGGDGTAMMKRICMDRKIEIIEPKYTKELNIETGRYIAS